MKQVSVQLLTLFCSLLLAGNIFSQTAYELSDLSENDWLSMTTEEHLNALGISNSQAKNQTFIGDFGTDYDNNKRWGHDYYEMEDHYENYGIREFENYNILENRRQRWSYNEFGDRIDKMRSSGRIWSEEYGGNGTFSATNPGNYINLKIAGGIDGVWVTQESTDNWSLSLVGAGALRTHYTPLTLSLPNVNGMRGDLQTTNTSISVLNSLVKNGTMLRAGQFRRKFGLLTLGATYANMYQFQGNREEGSSWYGSVSNYDETPMIMALRIVDDSPDDNEGGPLINQVRLKVNGRYRDDVIPTIIIDDIRRDMVTAIANPANSKYLDPILPGDQGGALDYNHLRLSSTMPKYADYLFMEDFKKGHNVDFEKNFDTETGSSYYSYIGQENKPLQVNGYQYAVYYYDLSKISGKIDRVEAIITVANDYRIQTAMVYASDVNGGHTVSGNNTSWYKSTYWNTAAQADGNIKDGSNMRTVKIDFGFQVATIVYGFDADLNYKGLKIKGEFVTNSNHFMFPDGDAGTGEPNADISLQQSRDGQKWSETDHAYYVTVQKDWTQFALAGEIFKMGKFYRPWLDSHLHTSGAAGFNRTMRLPLVEDNDDDDLYPDTMSIKRNFGWQLSSYQDSDGVFPGNDEDNDGVPDNNKNLNSTPDYDEDFLMFDADPDEFSFGNDYNNNSIPDHREDDMKYDIPYDLDRHGYHYYMSYNPQRSVKMTLGTMRTKGVGLDIKTWDDYFKLQMDYNVFGIGNLNSEYRYEEIQDNFRDKYIQVETSQQTYRKEHNATQYERFGRELYFDELEYRNSKVNRLFLASIIRAIPSITIENHVKLERNHQVEGTMYDKVYQPNDVINLLAMVNKVVYTKSWGNFEVSPGIKYRLYKKARSESMQPLRHYLIRIPLVMFKYIVSPKTDLMLGMQGLPGFEFKYTDLVLDDNNYMKKNYTIQLQNKSNYLGYMIWVGIGLSYNQIRFEKAYRKLENIKTTSTFVTVNCGY